MIQLDSGRTLAAEVVDADDFLAAMGNVCTPVTVVTTLAGSRPHGTTVSAFASLSLEPPLVMVALATTSDLLDRMETGSRFGVNVLAREQADLALRFASKGDHKFDGVDHVIDAGAPRLPGASTWLGCSVTDLLPGGDHVIVVGTVHVAEVADRHPLTYRARTFGTHADHIPFATVSPGADSDN